MKTKILISILLILSFAIVRIVAAKEEGDKTIRKVAVTIDDLPIAGPARKLSFDQQKEIFDKLILKLSEQKIPIIGFVNGDQLMVGGKLDERKVSFLKEWMSKGFDLGNHTYSHKSANKVSVEEYEKDILDDDNLLKPIIEDEGKQLKYFRHPFLNTGLSLETKQEIEKYLDEHGYEIAPVTIDNSEWLFAAAYEKAFSTDSTNQMRQVGKDYIAYMNSKFEWYEKKSEELFGKDIEHILLIHANRLNADYFNALCAMIKQRGCEFVTLEEVLKDKAYKSPDTFIKDCGISWIDRWALTAGKTKEFFIGEPRTPKDIMDIAGIYSE
jgi:peptidoglycan/xylan/chitin deacetylase (PgdA/CDA1 family)